MMSVEKVSSSSCGRLKFLRSQIVQLCVDHFRSLEIFMPRNLGRIIYLSIHLFIYRSFLVFSTCVEGLPETRQFESPR